MAECYCYQVFPISFFPPFPWGLFLICENYLEQLICPPFAKIAPGFWRKWLFLERAGEYAIASRLRVNATSNVGPYDADGGRRQGSGFEKKDDLSLDQ